MWIGDEVMHSRSETLCAGRVHLPLPGVDSTIDTSTDAAAVVDDDSARSQKRHKSASTADGADSVTDDIVVHTPADGCTVAFSSVPVSQWKNLPVMELIYQRNKPTEPPKVCELDIMRLQWLLDLCFHTF